MSTNMFLERTFEQPLSLAEVRGYARDGDWCFNLYKVDWRASFLAAGGRQMLCWFAAPDAESARMALRRVGADTERFWAGTIHEGPDPAVPNVLVARSFDEPVALEKIQAIARSGETSLAAHRVRYTHTIFASDRKRVLCFYQAPDAEAVRLAQREAAMSVTAIWAFERIGPD
jgi:hypothetical protein